jgi:hypothetical protein
LVTGHHDQVSVKFIGDFTSTAGFFRCTAGAEFVLDAATAGALIVAGIAVRIEQKALG